LALATFRKETPLIQVIDAPILPLEKTIWGKEFNGSFLGFYSLL
jgi:hypothetical protein